MDSVGTHFHLFIIFSFVPCLCVFVHVESPQVSESPGAGLAGGCELCDVGTRN